MKILITGVSGFVGWNATRYFGNRELHVQPTFRTLPHYLHIHSSERFQRPVELNVTDGRAVDEVVRRFQPTVILHAAALAHPQQIGSPDLLREVNVEGTANVARAASTVGAHLVFISTDIVYPANAGLVDESSPVAPSGANGYSTSKLEAEAEVEHLAGRWSIVRPSLIFGVGTPRSRSFTQFLDRRWEAGESAPVFTDQVRSFVYVDDLLAAIHRLVTSGDAGLGLFVCGGAEPMTRADFALSYARYRGVGERLCAAMQSHELPGYVGGSSDIRLDTAKLRALGWRPRPLEEAFAEMEEVRRS